MPTREACHVAVQKAHPTKQRLWKHAQARQNSKGQGPTPVLQIVCAYIYTEKFYKLNIKESVAEARGGGGLASELWKQELNDVI